MFPALQLRFGLWPYLDSFTVSFRPICNQDANMALKFALEQPRKKVQPGQTRRQVPQGFLVVVVRIPGGSQTVRLKQSGTVPYMAAEQRPSLSRKVLSKAWVTRKTLHGPASEVVHTSKVLYVHGTPIEVRLFPFSS